MFITIVYIMETQEKNAFLSGTVIMCIYAT